MAVPQFGGSTTTAGPRFADAAFLGFQRAWRLPHTPHPDPPPPPSQPSLREPVGYHSQVQPEHLQAVLPRVRQGHWVRQGALKPGDGITPHVVFFWMSGVLFLKSSPTRARETTEA